jgi:hypothetical protein
MTDNADVFVAIEDLVDLCQRVPEGPSDEGLPLRTIAEAVSESPVPSASDAPRSTVGTAGESTAGVARTATAAAMDSSSDTAAVPHAQLQAETMTDPDPSFTAEPLTLAALLEHYKQYIPEGTVPCIVNRRGLFVFLFVVVASSCFQVMLQASHGQRRRSHISARHRGPQHAAAK